MATDRPDADLAVTAEVGDSNDTADVLYFTLLDYNNPDLYRTLSVPLQ